VRFYFTGTEFLYDYNANLSKAVAAKRLPLTILCSHLREGLDYLWATGLKLKLSKCALLQSEVKDQAFESANRQRGLVAVNTKGATGIRKLQ